MNKLLYILASLIASRLILIYTKGAIASLVGCMLYILIFVLFSPRTRLEGARVGVWKSLLVVTAFALISFFVSSLLAVLLEAEVRDVSLFQGAVAVLLVPFAEELFFRATLFKMLDTLVAPLFSVFFSSLIFALSHTGLASIISAFVLGVLLSLIYKKTGSIRLPVICHTVNNLLAFLFTLKGF